MEKGKDGLLEARNEIDEIDRKIGQLFEDRMKAAEKIARYKMENDLPVFDGKREAEVLSKAGNYVGEDIRPYFCNVQKTIMKESKKLQRKICNDENFLHVSTENSEYDIMVGKGIWGNIGNFLNLDRKVLVVTDDGVPKEYPQYVIDASKEPYFISFRPGEEAKSEKNLFELLKIMALHNFTRQDCVVAVGGGVVGDLSGLAAALYMRGIDFYNVPTTLLSQVDSSVGGKTAIDFCGYKNIVGAFYQPQRVIIDTDVLKTIDPRQFNCGMAEVIKVFATQNKEMFETLEKTDTIDVEKIIVEALKLKINVVEQDEKEGGLRKVLNFGHTVGHAIESYSENFSCPMLHGECIALGMLVMSEGEAQKRIRNLLKKYNLPTKCNIDGEKLRKFLMNDKKSTGEKLTTVWVKNLGSFEFIQMTVDEILEAAEGAEII